MDNAELMGRWSAELTGDPGVVAVDVVEREPGERLVWEAADGGARIELALAEKGWGTSVSIRIAGAQDGSALEGLLDELGSPQRRPFTRN
jgi:hypothetical protein